MRLVKFLLLLLFLPPCVHAQGIHRCVGADSSLIFTDRACADVNATPMLPAPTSSAPDAGVHAVEVSRPPAVTCAADLQQLKQAVIDAFDARNPNRLAGLALWNGDGKEAVVADIRFYSRLMSRPLIAVKSISAAGTSADDDEDANASQLSLSAAPDPAPAAHGEALIVQTESDEGSGATRQTRFDVVHRSGCVWLRPNG